MSIVITGATGHLGRLVVENLLARGVAAGEITATGRQTDRLADLADAGVRVARADFADPASLDAAFAGATKLLLVSGLEADRVNQHRNAIAAAERAGVKHLVYTSAPYATTTAMLLAADHRATEELLAASPLPVTVLRNGWYVENYARQLPVFLEHGITGAAADGKVSIAPRREYAEAAAAVLTGTGHEGKTYELGGEAVTLTDVAAAFSAATGSEILYTNVSVETFQSILVGTGMPKPVAAVFADVDRAIADGELNTGTADLEGLLGRPATPLTTAVQQAVDQQRAEATA